MLHIPGLYVAESEGRGRGMFTAHEINKGDLIEICPIIRIPDGDLKQIHDTILHDYYFVWSGKDGGACIVLGYGSIYNHSATPNAQFIFDYPNLSMEIECLTTIAPGDEIFIDYAEGGKGEENLWFDPV